MPILHAIVLGVVQGLTEFFPISSSGHLALAPWLFGWNDFGANESLAKAFDVSLHMGTLVGALAYFWRDLTRYLAGAVRPVFHRSEGIGHDGKMAWLLVLSAVPAAIIGSLFSDAIDKLDDQIWLIAVMLIVFSLVLYWADRLPGHRVQEGFGVRDAALMGLGQAIALQPGVSRSGVTISVSRKLGFDRNSAARLSFLMSLPVIAGAGLFKAVDTLSGAGVPSSLYGAFFWGMLSSGVMGWLAVWVTLKVVRTHGFTPFVIYRIGVAAGVLVLIVTGVRPAVA